MEFETKPILRCWWKHPSFKHATLYCIHTDNYTSVDPKQFTVSKFRLKPVILISECVCSRCGHTNHPHPPHEGRQPETTGDKTTSETKKPTTPTNTKAARSKVALRTPTVNCLGKKIRTNKCLDMFHSTPKFNQRVYI